MRRIAIEFDCQHLIVIHFHIDLLTAIFAWLTKNPNCPKEGFKVLVTIETPGPLFTKLFRFRIKIRLKFQNEYFLDYFTLSVQENLIYVSIDMVNVVIYITCIRLKYMLETIRHNKVDHVIYWAQIFIAVATLKFTFSFIKKLRISRSLVWRTYFIKYQQSIVK